jgi:hypothetical protein
VKKGRGREGALGGKGSGIGREGEGQEGRERGGEERGGEVDSLVLTPLLFSNNSHTVSLFTELELHTKL